MSEKKSVKIWDIMMTKKVLGIEFSRQLPFVHASYAFSGYDTTSHPFEIGQNAVLSKTMTDDDFQSIGKVFFGPATKEIILKAGEEAMVSLYGGESNNSLNNFQVRKFYLKVASSKTSVKVQSLPPTAAVPHVPHFKGLFRSATVDRGR